MRSSIVSLLRFASVVICLTVLASFATFAVDEAKSASTRQREQLAPGAAGGASNASTGAGASAPTAAHRSALHRALDDAAGTLTSPFSSLVGPGGGEWAIRGFKLLAALLVYGFGLGYLARALRVAL